MSQKLEASVNKFERAGKKSIRVVDAEINFNMENHLLNGNHVEIPSSYGRLVLQDPNTSLRIYKLFRS